MGRGLLPSAESQIIDRKTDVLESIQESAENIRTVITGGASASQMAGWNIKARIAEKFIEGVADDDEKASVLRECELRDLNETPLELVENQMKKAKRMTQAIVSIDGMEKRANVLIEKCTTLEELEKSVEILKEKEAEVLQTLT